MPGPVSSITSTVPWPSCAGCDAFYASQPTARRSGTRPALCPLRWRALAFVCEVVDRRQARAAQHAGHPANRRAAGLHQSPGRLSEDITVDPHADDHGRKICPAGIGDEIFWIDRRIFRRVRQAQHDLAPAVRSLEHPIGVQARSAAPPRQK